MPCCLVNIYQGFGEIIIFLFSELWRSRQYTTPKRCYLCFRLYYSAFPEEAVVIFTFPLTIYRLAFETLSINSVTIDQSYTHVHTYIHTYTHTHLLAYIYMYIGLHYTHTHCHVFKWLVDGVWIGELIYWIFTSRNYN
jgi:hypothetical protein